MNVRLRNEQASKGVTHLGWRYVLGAFTCYVRVDSFALGVAIAARVAEAAGADARDHLKADIRSDCVIITVQTFDIGWTTVTDLNAVRRITTSLQEIDVQPMPHLGAATRSVQILELAIDAMDIPSIRPFWKAAMGYADEGKRNGPTDPLIDPLGQGPAIWFQQMGAPRPQRNRIHFDVSVPHDEAQSRMDAIVAAGGKLVYDAEAPAFWVFADAEGNEVCITTWQNRD
jgi:4a-hydroxytetrahydrobiopterin dehydratase